jgi:tRNA(Ile2) C34 agmatinyltransferase TiaS
MTMSPKELMRAIRNEIQARRIRAGLCPQCGGRTKDKGSYIRCVSCNWELTNGRWDDDGCIQMHGDQT